MKYPIETWKWKGIAGHLIIANRCRFHLHTQIGPYKISTIGAYYQTGMSEKMTEIGAGRDYETYVFTGEDNWSEIDANGISLDRDADSDPYKADELAEDMHMKMCMKYAEMQNEKDT